ncbi:calcium-binding protein [Bradyrhizobium sp.]|uniref:calcium-binding protein n=1 Tax=Bradyrhizobium sp. TaxID=376 RepID=UPI0025B82250|nr:calcium-binding protein [Bradyrhizobium sp.]
MRANPIRMFDTDNDATLDPAAVNKAASALFAKLDRDHNGALGKRELGGRLSIKELAVADPDYDGALTAEEYLLRHLFLRRASPAKHPVVERRFTAANRTGMERGCQGTKYRARLALLCLLK